MGLISSTLTVDSQDTRFSSGITPRPVLTLKGTSDQLDLETLGSNTASKLAVIIRLH
jgi:hypothetical protein